MNLNSVFLLISTDGYFITSTKYSTRDEARGALKKAWDELYDNNFIYEEWEELSSFHEDDAILYYNGENVFIWKIIEVSFTN